MAWGQKGLFWPEMETPPEHWYPAAKIMLYNNPDIHSLNFRDSVNLKFQDLRCKEFKFH